MFPEAAPAGQSGAFSLWRSGPWLLGHASLDAAASIEAAARELYENLLDAARDVHLARIWNYVPGINALNRERLENYRSFCRSRSLAFEARYGAEFKRRVPSASAVGCAGARFTVVFAASAHQPSHVENPRQVPAYEYPPEHGPRSPAFARATVVPDGPGTHAVFISGTAAIRGHRSVAPGEPLVQLECTLENLRELSRACGLGADLGAGRSAARHFKIYVRNARDAATVARPVEAAFAGGSDRLTFLQADICRRELDVEIEASIFGATIETRPAAGDPR